MTKNKKLIRKINENRYGQNDLRNMFLFQRRLEPHSQIRAVKHQRLITSIALGAVLLSTSIAVYSQNQISASATEYETMQTNQKSQASQVIVVPAEEIKLIPQTPSPESPDDSVAPIVRANYSNITAYNVNVETYAAKVHAYQSASVQEKTTVIAESAAETLQTHLDIAADTMSSVNAMNTVNSTNTVVMANVDSAPALEAMTQPAETNILTKDMGRLMHGPAGGQETYYNLPMEGVINWAYDRGFDPEEYPYWIREDGVKMFGPYVIVAANLSVHPRDSIVECSRGTAIVLDTGSFAKNNPTQLDVATNW